MNARKRLESLETRLQPERLTILLVRPADQEDYYHQGQRIGTLDQARAAWPGCDLVILNVVYDTKPGQDEHKDQT